MKKLICILIVLFFLAPVGCAGFGKWSPGAQQVIDFVCNPTAQEQAEAAKALAALDMIQAGAAVFYPPLAMVKASNVLLSIKGGGCFLISELEAALKLLQDIQMQYASLKGLKAAPRPTAQQYPALQAVVDRSKK